MTIHSLFFDTIKIRSCQDFLVQQRVSPAANPIVLDMNLTNKLDLEQLFNKEKLVIHLEGIKMVV